MFKLVLSHWPPRRRRTHRVTVTDLRVLSSSLQQVCSNLSDSRAGGLAIMRLRITQLCPVPRARDPPARGDQPEPSLSPWSRPTVLSWSRWYYGPAVPEPAGNRVRSSCPATRAIMPGHPGWLTDRHGLPLPASGSVVTQLDHVSITDILATSLSTPIRMIYISFFIL